MAKVSVSDLVIDGQYNHWRVLGIHEKAQNNGYNKKWCTVVCDCGKVAERTAVSIAHGTSRSCVACGLRTHGQTKCPEYNIWAQILQRCLNPKCKAFKNYGGRGITVTPEWSGVGGFAAFFSHVGPRPSSTYSIHRINNDGNYEPGNVCWASKSTQCNNMRKSRYVTFRGETHTVSEWAKLLGVTPAMISWRLQQGWSVETTLTTPSTRAMPSVQVVHDPR